MYEVVNEASKKSNQVRNIKREHAEARFRLKRLFNNKEEGTKV